MLIFSAHDLTFVFMKKFKFYPVCSIILFFFILVFSCTNKKDGSSSIFPTDITDNSYRASMLRDSINYDSTGLFIYNHIKKHLLFYEPTDLMPKEGRERMKFKFDSVKAIPNKKEGFHLDEMLRKKLISKTTHSLLLDIERELKSNIGNGDTKDETSKWFESKILSIKINNNIHSEEKHLVIQNLTVLKYALQATYEGLIKEDKSGRIQVSNCTIQQVQCAASNISTYAGVGSAFGSTGTAIGAVTGLFVALATCNCSSPCAFPSFVSTPDVCYDPYVGLKVRAAGFGNTSDGFVFKLYKSDNLITANELAVYATNQNEYTFSNAELQGNNVVYMYTATNCGGSLLYQPQPIAINITYLGWPDFQITGPTNPYITSYVSYNMVGRNLNNVTWSLYTRNQAGGTLNSTYINTPTAWVQWNPYPGWVVVAGEAHTSCGACYRQLDVYTHN